MAGDWCYKGIITRRTVVSYNTQISRLLPVLHSLQSVVDYTVHLPKEDLSSFLLPPHLNVSQAYAVSAMTSSSVASLKRKYDEDKGLYNDNKFSLPPTMTCNPVDSREENATNVIQCSLYVTRNYTKTFVSRQ